MESPGLSYKTHYIGSTKMGHEYSQIADKPLIKIVRYSNTEMKFQYKGQTVIKVFAQEVILKV